MEYPHSPGFKDITTSKDAARKLKPKINALQQKFLALFEGGFTGTADDAGAALGISPFTARPRCTELYKRGLIERSHKVQQDGSMRWVLRLYVAPGKSLPLPF